MRVALEVYAGLEYAGFQRKLKLGDSLGCPARPSGVRGGRRDC
jgi:hypothetical protein